MDDHSITTTSTLLLEALRDERDQDAWANYVARYRPILLRYAARFGAQPAHAEDLAQQTLLKFCLAYRAGTYDRERGRLRTWLLAIARNEIRTWLRSRRPDEAAGADRSGADLLAQTPDDDSMEQAWEAEWRDAILREALRDGRVSVDSSTWEAFERTALQREPPADVARRLGMSVNAVYGAKRRVFQRVRQSIRQFENDF